MKNNWGTIILNLKLGGHWKSLSLMKSRVCGSNLQGSYYRSWKIGKKGLKKWAGQIQINRKKTKRILMEKLVELAKAEREDKNLAELIDTKINLNFEIEKDECY